MAVAADKARARKARAQAWAEALHDLEARRSWARAGSGPDRAEIDHRAGRLSVRERIGALTDADSFQEFGTLVTTPAPNPDDPDLPTTFVSGLARIDGRPVAIGAEDFTIQGGGAGTHLARSKMAFGGFLEELAHDYKVPLVLLLNGVGGSITIQERKGFPMLVSTMSSYPMYELLDRVPVVAAVLGPAAGAVAARAAVSHFSLMSRPYGSLFIGGPPVVRQATGQVVDKYELGGAAVHVDTAGTIDCACDTETEIFRMIRAFLSFMPRNVWELPPCKPTDDSDDRSCDELLEIVDPSPRKIHDPLRLIQTVVDDGDFFEMGEAYGRSLRAGIARIAGHSVGIFASDPRHLGGAMDGPAADKQTRFAEMFDCFHMPIVYFVDVPGFMVGPTHERSGLIRRASRAVQAIQRATVPVFTVQVKRSFGLAGLGTGNLNGSSVRLAWPSGLWGDMPVGGGVEAEFGDIIAAAPDPVARRQELTEQFVAQNSIWRTVERFGVEEVIDPRETRRVLARLVRLAASALEPGPKAGPQVRP